MIINDNEKSISFLWTEMIQYKIEDDISSDTHSLKLRVNSEGKSKSLNISSLEKTPTEIEKIIVEYRTAANIDFARLI